MQPGRDVTVTAWDPVQAPLVRAIAEPDESRLWQTLLPILRLDAEDAVQAWREHVARLEQRAAALNERRFAALRFEGPGTDLTVGLIRGHRWLAADFQTTWGPV